MGLMIILNSKLYATVEVISFFFLLNVLWFLMCIPIVTIFPATAAMFGVIRQWKLKGDTTIFKNFFRFFKENFKQSFIIGLVFFIFVAVIYIDIMFIGTLNPLMQKLLLGSVYLLGFIVLFTSIYLFPIMVHYKLTLIGVVKTSFLYSIRYLPTTILAFVFLALMLTMIYRFTVLSVISFSVMAYLIFTICYSRIIKTEELVAKTMEE